MGRRAPGPPAVGEGHLRLLLDGVQDCGIVMVSRNGMILTWNSAAEEINGYSAGEVIGQPLALLYPPEDVLVHRPERELELARCQGTYRTEGWRLRKEGARVWVSHVVTPLHDRTGRLRGYGTATRLLDDRVRAQDLLAVLDAVPEAVLGIDVEGRILLANAAAERLFGTEPQGLLGRAVDSLLPQRFRAAHAVERAGYVANHRPRPMSQRRTVCGLRDDGTVFPAEVRLSSVQTPRGPIVTALVRDLDGPEAARDRGGDEVHLPG
jgi:PAS domain S-box-containing protein